MVPDRRLLALLAVASAAAYLAFFWPAMQLPGWACLLVVAVLLGWDVQRTRAGVSPTLELELPERCRVRGEAELVVTLRNGDSRPIRLRYRLELPEDLGGDRESDPLDLAVAESHVAKLRVVPGRRGMRPVGPLEVLVRSELGLHWRRLRTTVDRPLPVHPNPGRTGEASLTGDRSLRARQGIRPRRRRGEGLEFESLREYVAGDDPRRIDWRATARAGKPIVRQFQTERNHDVVVAVETGRLMGVRVRGTTKLDLALDAAVALALATRGAGDRIGFVGFDREVHAFVPPVDSRRALSPILDATLPIVPRAYEASYRSLAEVMGVRQKRRSLLVVLTDFVEAATATALERYLALLARRHCVLLIGLRDPILSSALEPAPDLDAEGFHRRLVVQDLLADREVVLSRIRRLGVLTLDLHPEQITAPMLERYLEVREAGLL